MNIITLQNLSTDHYKIKTWNNKYPDNRVTLEKNNWNNFYNKEKTKKQIAEIEEFLSDLLKNGVEIYPYPRLVFSSLNTMKPSKIRVVFLAQDPYIKSEQHNKKTIPQAMGFALSVPKGVRIPPSLRNIYNNLLKYNHIDKYPNHGNLISWVKQGCFLLNSALTVTRGKSNSHSKIWQEFTNNLITYISENTTNTIFVLWGSNSLKKSSLIDKQKHHIIVSSHPSPLSYKNKLKNYPAFVDFDHFGKINELLKKNNKKPIDWKII